MSRRVAPKRWKTLVAVGTAVGLVHSAPLQAQKLQHDHMAPAQIWLAADTEAGESGEGGESGSAGHADESLKALTGLALIEGHLRAGITLYLDGQADAAKTHMKHSGDEIYASVEPVLEEVGADGFATELEALAAAVESGAPVADADAALATLMAAIEHAGDETRAPARVRFDTMIAVIRVAAEEDGIGVVDGQISNLHEYQDD